MSNVMAWDELTLLREEAVSTFNRRKKLTQKDVERFCDYMEFVLCLIYDYGWKDAELIVGTVPFKDGLDDIAVTAVIAGETFRERVEKVLTGIAESVPEDLLRIIDTEAHRDYNTGVFDAAEKSGKNVKKLWWTMADGRVRDTHDYLHGVTVGLNDRFYTYDGDSALYPGDFTLPENNVNCRCWITLQ